MRLSGSLPRQALFSHINNTPKPDSVQEPGFVFLCCRLVRQPHFICSGFNIQFVPIQLLKIIHQSLQQRRIPEVGTLRREKRIDLTGKVNTA